MVNSSPSDETSKHDKPEPSLKVNGYVNSEGKLTQTGKDVVDSSYEELMEEHGEAIRALADK